MKSKKTASTGTSQATSAEAAAAAAAAAPAPSAATSTPATCPGNCATDQNSAIAYMRAEILWSTIYMNAWADPALMQELQQNADNANALIERLGVQYGLPVKVPPGVTLKIVFDSTSTVNLVFPAFQHIPPSNLDMVPHAL